MTRIHSRLVLGTLLLLAVGAAPAGVPVVTVADTTTSAPGGGGTFTRFAQIPPALDGSDVAFMAVSGDVQGIYAFLFGTLLRVADTSTPVPGTAWTFSGFSEFVDISRGKVVFRGEVRDPQTGAQLAAGIYLWDRGELTTVVDTLTVWPGVPARFESVAVPTISGDTISFVGTYDSAPAIYRRVGGALESVVDSEDFAPDVLTHLEYLVSDGDNLAFITVVTEPGGYVSRGVHALLGGQVTRIANHEVMIPGTSEGTFWIPQLPSISGSRVTFNTYDGVYSAEGGQISTVADVTTVFNNADPFLPRFSHHAAGGNNTAFVVSTVGRGSHLYLGSPGSSPQEVPLPALPSEPEYLGLARDGYDGDTLVVTASSGSPQVSFTGVYLVLRAGSAAASAFSPIQPVRIAGPGGHQAVLYNYSTSSLIVTPYRESPARLPNGLTIDQWTAAFLYDYTEGRCTQALHQTLDTLQD